MSLALHELTPKVSSRLLLPTGVCDSSEKDASDLGGFDLGDLSSEDIHENCNERITHSEIRDALRTLNENKAT